VRTDFRGGEDAGLNLMLRRAASSVVEHAATDEDLGTLASRVQKALEALAT
jgi:hypothetical protein